MASTNNNAKAPVKRNIVLLGNSGVGKSYIANMLALNKRIVKITGPTAVGANSVGEVVTKDLFVSSDAFATMNGVTQSHTHVEFEEFVLHDLPGLIEKDDKRIQANKVIIDKALKGLKNAVVVFVMPPLRLSYAANVEAFSQLSKAYLFENASYMVIVNNCNNGQVRGAETFKGLWNRTVFPCSYFHHIRTDAEEDELSLIKRELLEMHGTTIAASGKPIELAEERLKRKIEEKDAEFRRQEEEHRKEKQEQAKKLSKLKAKNDKLIQQGNMSKGTILRVVLTGPCELTQMQEQTATSSRHFQLEQFESLKTVTKQGADLRLTLGKIVSLGFSGSNDSESYRTSKTLQDFSETTSATIRQTLVRRLDRGEYIVQIAEVLGVNVKGQETLIKMTESYHYVDKQNFDNFADKIYHQADVGIFTAFGKTPQLVSIKVFEPLPLWQAVFYHGRQDRYMFIRNDKRINIPWDFLSDKEMQQRSHCDNHILWTHNGDTGVNFVYRCEGHCRDLFVGTSPL